MKKQFFLLLPFLLVAFCFLSLNTSELKACDANHISYRSTPILQAQKNQPKIQPKQIIKKKEKEKEESFLMFLNPFIKI